MAISGFQLKSRGVDLVKALKRRSEKLLNVQAKDGLYLCCLYSIISPRLAIVVF